MPDKAAEVAAARNAIADVHARGTEPVAQAGGNRRRRSRGAANPVVDFIANEENSIRKGYDQTSDSWKPHTSLEGGTETLAYGHKLTPAESKSGTVSIGGKEVKVADGITDAQAKQLLKQDTAKARNAVDSLVTFKLNANQKAALTSLIYNVGIDSFKNSKALKALNKGDLDTFRREAFGDKGWINYKNHPGGLRPRRQREEKLFFGG